MYSRCGVDFTDADLQAPRYQQLTGSPYPRVYSGEGGESILPVSPLPRTRGGCFHGGVLQDLVQFGRGMGKPHSVDRNLTDAMLILKCCS